MQVCGWGSYIWGTSGVGAWGTSAVQVGRQCRCCCHPAMLFGCLIGGQHDNTGAAMLLAATDKILGCHIMSANAGELIHEVSASAPCGSRACSPCRRLNRLCLPVAAGGGGSGVWGQHRGPGTHVPWAPHAQRGSQGSSHGHRLWQASPHVDAHRCAAWNTAWPACAWLAWVRVAGIASCLVRIAPQLAFTCLACSLCTCQVV